MTQKPPFLPFNPLSTMPRPISLLVYPGFQILDAAGPLSAFETANRFGADSYRLALVSRDGGPVASSSGAVLLTRPVAADEAPDTLLVVGGDGVDEASACPATLDLVRATSTRARRTASVCSGAWLLASAGLLDGRRATTHWRRTSRFKLRFPAVQLDADLIYVQDGPVWTAAGISAGIDLALALIADDLGEAVARQVARQLVVYYRRPGGQSQFSESDPGQGGAQVGQHAVVALGVAVLAGAEHGRAGDEGVGTGAGDLGDVVHLHAAVDLQQDAAAGTGV
jgi:transcriptional regulator GlxA family with amidase domain